MTPTLIFTTDKTNLHSQAMDYFIFVEFRKIDAKMG